MGARVRRFEAGPFWGLVQDTLRRAGVTYKYMMGKGFKIGRKFVTYRQMVELANHQRTKEGKEPLPIPKHNNLNRQYEEGE